MPVVLADLCIEARWIVPMAASGQVLENHSLVVRDGRILDILPSSAVAVRYDAAARVRRPAHLLMPGLVNCTTRAAMSLFRGLRSPGLALDRRSVGPEFVRDGAMTAIADMLASGITCFADRYHFPDQTARAATEQGMRAVVGLPMAEGLGMRDEYRGHPLISTAIAPHAANTLSDASFARIATLADELDAAIVIDLHESAAEIAESVAVHGLRPIERLWKLGLLTPALNAVHMVHVTAADIELAQRTGVSISLCPQSSLRQGFGLGPAAAFAAAGIRLGLGSGGEVFPQSQDIWAEMRLLALTAGAGTAPLTAWDVLAVATRGGASVLGLDADIGSLESGKWADLCCVDLGGPATQPVGDPVTQLVFCGGRDLVSDVWVAGRQLLCERDLTRLEWPAVAARANAWAARLNTGG
ncbi:MAG: amidohydrolase family protein [Pseudomonadota bacterium]|nr:amidohydrolase family protein [Pseudomonadota bacterium]